MSVVGPELMVLVPSNFTVYQGFDVLFHSTECYISKSHNLMSDMLALTAIENIGKYLVCVVKEAAIWKRMKVWRSPTICPVRS